MENAWDCCVAGNISEKTWWLQAPALLLLVLPQKSNVLPDLSASEQLLAGELEYSNSNPEILGENGGGEGQECKYG